MPYLFSYGSNNTTQLGQRLGRTVYGIPAVLRGYRRVFRGMSQKWGGGVASLERTSDASTFGYITDVTGDELDVLDVYEGVNSGKYRRVKVVVEALESSGYRKMPATCYISTSRMYNEPSRKYLEAVAKTISEFWTGGLGPVTWKDIPLR